jgi:hypothetical protein
LTKRHLSDDPADELTLNDLMDKEVDTNACQIFTKAVGPTGKS